MVYGSKRSRDQSVSQYRLTAHLSSAFLIYGFMFWVALSLLYPDKNKSNNWSKYTLSLTALIIVTLSRCFVVGLKAGKFSIHTL